MNLMSYAMKYSAGNKHNFYFQYVAPAELANFAYTLGVFINYYTYLLILF